MSYSFTKQGNTAADVNRLVGDELKAVVAAMPEHAVDAPFVAKTVAAALGLVVAVVGEQVHVAVTGSLYMSREGLKQVGIHVNVLVKPDPAKAAKPVASAAPPAAAVKPAA